MMSVMKYEEAINQTAIYVVLLPHFVITRFLSLLPHHHRPNTHVFRGILICHRLLDLSVSVAGISISQVNFVYLLTYKYNLLLIRFPR